MPTRRALSAAMVAVVIGGCPHAMRAPPPDAVPRLKKALAATTYGYVVTDDTPTALLTLTLSEAELGPPVVRVRGAAPGDVPPAALRPASPRDVPEVPGLYVALLDPGGAIRYAASVGDPRRVLHEDAGAGLGSWAGHAASRPIGSIAIRIPWIAGARLWLFEIDRTGSVSEVLGELPLSGTEHPRAEPRSVRPRESYR